MEKKLDLDDKYADEDDLSTGDVNSENPSERKKLLMKIEEKYREYGKETDQVPL